MCTKARHYILHVTAACKGQKMNSQRNRKPRRQETKYRYFPQELISHHSGITDKEVWVLCCEITPVLVHQHPELSGCITTL